MDELPKPEWVKLIPADSIPVFCFAPETYDQDLERYGDQLRAFFGERKVLAIRGVVDIYAIADRQISINPDQALAEEQKGEFTETEPW